MQSNEVSVTKTTSYEQEEVTRSIRRHFELLGLSEQIKPDMSVLLKPNLLMKRRPNEATTTHPAVIAGIIVCLKELGVTKITLADSPGGPYIAQALNGIYEATGMKRLAEEYGIELNRDFSSYEQKTNGKKVQSFTLITPVKNADYIIDIAKLKTHSMTTLSGAVKNLFGTVPGLMKPEFHFRFPDKVEFASMLVDLCETVRPNVTFVDAVESMEGDGPSGGTVRHSNMIIAGTSPYNVDILLCKITGMKPQKVPMVSEAIERGLCVSSHAELELLGDELENTEGYVLPNVNGVDFMQKIWKPFRVVLSPIANALLVSKPVIRKKGCIGCGKCAESCPAKTISIVNRKAVIDYDKCIKCFCCHEMCPVKTIEIKRFKPFDL